MRMAPARRLNMLCAPGKGGGQMKVDLRGRSLPFCLIRRYFTDGVGHAAAELAFFLLFSVCPLLMVLNSLLGLAHIPEDALLSLTRLLPDDVRGIILSYLEYLGMTDSLRPLLLGAAMTLYFLSRVVRSMMYAMNRIYGHPNRRGAVRNVIVSILMTAGFLLLLAASLFLLVLGVELVALVERWFPMLADGLATVRMLCYPLALGLVLFVLLMIYWLLPPTRVRWRDVMPGAVFSLAGWMLLTRAFSYYVDHMARYSILYGSIGAIIVLMLWLYLTSTTLLMGAVLNDALADRKRDHPATREIHNIN